MQKKEPVTPKLEKSIVPKSVEPIISKTEKEKINKEVNKIVNIIRTQKKLSKVLDEDKKIKKEIVKIKDIQETDIPKKIIEQIKFDEKIKYVNPLIIGNNKIDTKSQTKKNLIDEEIYLVRNKLKSLRTAEKIEPIKISKSITQPISEIKVTRTIDNLHKELKDLKKTAENKNTMNIILPLDTVLYNKNIHDLIY